MSLKMMKRASEVSPVVVMKLHALTGNS